MPAFINSVGVQTLTNEVKASGGCHGFFRGNFIERAKVFWAQIRRGEFDKSGFGKKYGNISNKC